MDVGIGQSLQVRGTHGTFAFGAVSLVRPCQKHLVSDMHLPKQFFRDYCVHVGLFHS